MDFPGYGGQDLAEVSWDEWFATFDQRNLRFVYQEHTKDGSDSNADQAPRCAHPVGTCVAVLMQTTP
jgi:hypothetical protein